MFYTARAVICDEELFKAVLNEAKLRGISKSPYKANSPFYHITIGRSKVELLGKVNGTLTKYQFNLDGEDKPQYITGGEAYRILKKWVPQLPDLRKKEFYKKFYKNNISEIGTIAAELGFNPQYSGTRFQKCYGYDLNSAWPYFMTQPMPDTNINPRTMGFVEEGEIGFTSALDGWELNYIGERADYIFPLIESPFKDFVKYYYDIKKNTKNQEEKIKAKEILNYSIGYLQKVNPFIRATVIGRANQYIHSLIYENRQLKSNVLQWNTDSIISTCELPELRISEELGDWKLQHVGNFAYKGYAYQWNYEVPTQRGISKGWFKERYPNGFDVLKDKLPTSEDNIYIITEDYRLEVRNDI